MSDIAQIAYDQAVQLAATATLIGADNNGLVNLRCVLDYVVLVFKH